MTAVAVPRSNGRWGMVLFVAVEGTLFAALLGSYGYLRFNTVLWPPAGVPKPLALWPIVLGAIVVVSVAPVQGALRAARGGLRLRAWLLLLAALGVQATVFGAQIHLFLGDLDRFQPQGSAYASIYFTLLGAGLAHVAVGLLLDAWFVARLTTGITRYRLAGLEALALYWGFVAVVTAVVVATQLSPLL